MASAEPGRLLILTLGDDGTVERDLERAAALATHAITEGWQVGWVRATANPARLGSRLAHWHTDASAQVAATQARVRAREEAEKLRQRPPRFLRRLEERLKVRKHARSESESALAPLSRLWARVTFRFIRPLRKVHERLFPSPVAATPAALTPEPPSPQSGEIDLATLLAGCGPTDLVLLCEAQPRHLEWLLTLVPAMGRDRPIDATLCVCFAAAEGSVGKGEVDLATLAQRWQTGAPFRRTCFFAGDDATAARRTTETGFRVQARMPGLLDLTLRSLTSPGNPHPEALAVDRFGPVALMVSAMWGRTGSTSIFDSQTRYLVQRGFLVVRVLIDHWPHHGEDRTRRIDGFAGENFEAVRPHAWTIVERDDSPAHRERIGRLAEFQQASTVKRMLLLFAEPQIADPATLAWAARNARVAVVNHLPHVPFAERLTRAPIVFETHDIYTNLLGTHGIPEFVPPNPKAHEEELAEETEVFARVRACVNLSENDDSLASRFAPVSRVVRPYARSQQLRRRSWPDVVHANGLGATFLREGRFDLMLWGDWHGGNIKGIQWFIEQVLPRFERIRNARIVIAGRVAKGLPKGLAEGAGILVAGFVDHLDDFILRTKVLLVPDQGGTGISIKAMDIFALGRAFVSTSAGMRCVDPGETGYRPVDDAEAFGQEIVRLLDSPAAREQRAAVARRLYQLNFSREAYAGNWDAVLRAAVPEVLAEAMAMPGPTSTAPSPTPTPNPASRPAMQSTKATSPRISIIICTYDRYDVLPDAIASALAQDLPSGDFEILVIDNSPDQANAARWATEYAGEPVVRYHLEPIPGLSNARNVGTEMAKAPIVVFMDDDAIAPPHWAKEILAAFAAYPTAGIVGGRVYPKWIGDQGAPWLHEDNIGYLSVINWGNVRRQAASNEWLAGCNIAFRRDAILAVGGFSRSLGRVGSGASLLSNEETAIAEKIHANGLISVYAPDADLQHVIDPKRLTREWFRKRAAWQAVSDFIKDPKKVAEYAAQAKQHLRDAMDKGWRSVPMGTFHDTNDKETFKGDMGVMYDLVIACLAGGFEVPNTPKA